MGVVNKILSRAELRDHNLKFLEIELNEGPIIHIQSDSFRIEMRIEEFSQLSSKVIESANKLMEYKGFPLKK